MNTKTVKIKFSVFTGASNADFITLSGSVLNALIEHSATFNNPPITTAVLEADIATLVEMNNLADGDNGSHNDRTARDLQRDGVYSKLVLNGLYVAGLANAKTTYEQKKALVELAAYPVANDTHNPVEVVPVTGLKVNVPTIPGMRTVSARWVRGKCDSFIVMGTQGNPSSPSAEWKQLLICSKAKCEITLEPGIWAIRVIGVYSAGQAAPSNDVSFVIS